MAEDPAVVGGSGHSATVRLAMTDLGPTDGQPDQGGESRRRGGIFDRWPNWSKFAALFVVVALVAAGAWWLGSSDDDSQVIYVEAADSVGMDPFTTAGIAPSVPPAGGSSSTPKTQLFGGTGDNGLCNPDDLVAFLQSNPAKAKAWVAALNSDPTLTWAGGTSIAITDIAAYVAGLRPSILPRDFLVTNHGYKNGVATPRQSLLKKGTAVLLGRGDVPRVRCFCGNPLIPSDGGSGTTATSTEETTTAQSSATTVGDTTSTSGATTSTSGDIDTQSECEAIGPMPSGATNVTNAPVDFNAAGIADEIRVYQLGAVWRVRATVDGSPVADDVLAGPGPAMTAIGGATVDGYPVQEAWVKVGSGSSTDIIGLLMLLDCELKRVELNGTPAEFPIGATATAADGLGCYGFDVGIEVFTSTSSDGVTYTGTSQIYTIDVTGPTPVFVLGAAANQSETNPSPGFTAMSTFNCDNLNTIP